MKKMSTEEQMNTNGGATAYCFACGYVYYSWSRTTAMDKVVKHMKKYNHNKGWRFLIGPGY